MSLFVCGWHDKMKTPDRNTWNLAHYGRYLLRIKNYAGMRRVSRNIIFREKFTPLTLRRPVFASLHNAHSSYSFNFRLLSAFVAGWPNMNKLTSDSFIWNLRQRGTSQHTVNAKKYIPNHSRRRADSEYVSRVGQTLREPVYRQLTNSVTYSQTYKHSTFYRVVQNKLHKV